MCMLHTRLYRHLLKENVKMAQTACPTGPARPIRAREGAGPPPPRPPPRLHSEPTLDALDPSFRSLSGRLELTARPSKFNDDSLSVQASHTTLFHTQSHTLSLSRTHTLSPPGAARPLREREGHGPPPPWPPPRISGRRPCPRQMVRART